MMPPPMPFSPDGKRDKRDTVWAFSLEGLGFILFFF